MLRYCDDTFDAATKAQYRALLSSKIGQPVPTEQEEKMNPKSADGFYERCGGWLRENTRNATKFPVLFSENVTYGYRRNLLGLKWPALGLNAVMVALCLFILYRKGNIDPDDDVTIRLLIVLAFAMIHAIYMVFAVSRQSDRRVADIRSATSAFVRDVHRQGKAGQTPAEEALLAASLIMRGRRTKRRALQ
jgi:hypothetical protein